MAERSQNAGRPSAADFRIELSQDGRRILTFGTQEGFTISFSLGEELSEKMGHAHLKIDG